MLIRIYEISEGPYTRITSAPRMQVSSFPAYSCTLLAATKYSALKSLAALLSVLSAAFEPCFVPSSLLLCFYRLRLDCSPVRDQDRPRTRRSVAAARGKVMSLLRGPHYCPHMLATLD